MLREQLSGIKTYLDSYLKKSGVFGLKPGTNTNPEDVASAIYGQSGFYADIYSTTVAPRIAKQQQYMDIANLIVPNLERNNAGEFMVLEIGPGRTPLLKDALDSRGYTDGIRYIGLEKFPKMINTDDTFPIEMIQGEADSLPFADESLDAIVLNSVLLSCNPDKFDAIFKQFNRVLKKDGIIVITELDVNTSGQISRNVLSMEIQDIKNNLLGEVMNANPDEKSLLDVVKGPIARLRFYITLASRLIPLLPSKIMSDQANALVTETNPGFELSGLLDHLQGADFQIIETLRTYADSYHLIKGSKKSSS